MPVSDTDQLQVAYADPLELMRDLRAMGEANALMDRPRRPISRPVLARAREIYRQRFSRPDGRVLATFEIVSMTGWAPQIGEPPPVRHKEPINRVA